MKNYRRGLLIFILCLVIGFNESCDKTEDTNNNTTNNNNPTVTDIDSNVYQTVVIGTQTWMVSNLKTTRYRDGSGIQNVPDASAWENLTTGALCEYDNDPANNTAYGKLYNWYAVNTGLLAPQGWHVPTDAEWTVLENYLGNDNLTGGKLKEKDTLHWWPPNTGATNETGFTALPGGERFSTGSYYNIRYNGYWWTSSTGTDPGYGYYRSMDFNLSTVIRSDDYKTGGLSVRCIKD